MVPPLIPSITKNISFLASLFFFLLLTGCDAQDRIRGGKKNINVNSQRWLQSTDNETVSNITQAAACKKKWEECTTNEETCGSLICVKALPQFETGYAAEATSCNCLNPAAKNMADLHYFMLNLFLIARYNFNEGIDENPFLDFLMSMPVLESIPNDAVLFGEVGRLCIAMDLPACEYSNDLAERQTYGTALDIFTINIDAFFERIRSENVDRRLQGSLFFPQAEVADEVGTEELGPGPEIDPLDETSAPFICPSPGPTLAPTPGPIEVDDSAVCVVSKNSGFSNLPTFEYYKKIKKAYGNARKVNPDLPDIPLTPKDAIKKIIEKIIPEGGSKIKNTADVGKQAEEEIDEIDGDGSGPGVSGEDGDLPGIGTGGGDGDGPSGAKDPEDGLGDGGQIPDVDGGEGAGSDIPEAETIAADAGEVGEEVGTGAEVDAEAGPEMLILQAASLSYWVDKKKENLNFLPQWWKDIIKLKMDFLKPFAEAYHYIMIPVKMVNKAKKKIELYIFPWKRVTKHMREKSVKALKYNREEKNTGAVEFFTESCWAELHDNGWSSGGTAIDAYWQHDEGFPWIVYGLNDGAVMQYDGFDQSWSQLPREWGSGISTLQANFIPNPNFQDMLVQAVVGLFDGSVFYWTGTSWNQLHGDGWDSGVAAMSVQFASDSDDNQVRVVVGLSDASIQYWNGTDFKQLQSTGWDSTLTSMSMDVAWKDDEMPQIMVGLGNGDVFFYDNGWNQIRTVECSSNCGIFQIKAQFFTNNLRVVMATGDAEVWYYDEHRIEQWEELHDDGYQSFPNGFCAMFPLSDNTDAYPDVVIGLENGAIERMNSQGSWSQIQEVKSYGVVTMECNFLQENEDDLRFIVSFDDGSVGLYPLSNSCGDVDLIQGTGWNNEMSVISASFHPSGNVPPRFVGGLNILTA